MTKALILEVSREDYSTNLLTTLKMLSVNYTLVQEEAHIELDTTSLETIIDVLKPHFFILLYPSSSDRLRMKISDCEME